MTGAGTVMQNTTNPTRAPREGLATAPQLTASSKLAAPAATLIVIEEEGLRLLSQSLISPRIERIERFSFWFLPRRESTSSISSSYLCLHFFLSAAASANRSLFTSPNWQALQAASHLSNSALAFSR